MISLLLCTAWVAACGKVTVPDDGGTGGSHGTGGAGAGVGNGGAGGAAGGQGDGGPGSACRSDQDCASTPARLCLAPGQPPPCGICVQPIACNIDSDCAGNQLGAAMICDTATCTCDTAKSCVPGCSGDGDCANWQSCGLDHRCVGRSCGGGDTCPANFVCGSDSRCTRKPCSSDGDCHGACVKGACYDSPGACAPAVV